MPGLVHVPGVDGLRGGEKPTFQRGAHPQAQCASSTLVAEEGGRRVKAGPGRAQARRTALSRGIVKAARGATRLSVRFGARLNLENRISSRTQHRILNPPT
jgi:hypothetical protein